MGGADSLGKLDRAWSARFVVRVLLGPPLAVALLEHFLQDTPLLDVVMLRLQLAHRSMVRRRPVPPQRRCADRGFLSAMEHFPADTECEVLVEVGGDMVWCFGVIAEWRHDLEDGTWTAWVRYCAPDGNRIDIFPSHRLRQP